MNLGRRIFTGSGWTLLSSTGARLIGTVAACCCNKLCCVYRWIATASVGGSVSVGGGGTCQTVGAEEEAIGSGEREDIDWYYVSASNPCRKDKIVTVCDPSCEDSGDCTASAPSAPTLPCCAECSDPSVYYSEPCGTCIKPYSGGCELTISVSFTWCAAIPPVGDPLRSTYEKFNECVAGETYTWTVESGSCGETFLVSPTDYPCPGIPNYSVFVDATCSDVSECTPGCRTCTITQGSPFGRPDLTCASGSISCSELGDATNPCTTTTDTTTGPHGTVTFTCCVDSLP
jgi:hypothetical protein